MTRNGVRKIVAQAGCRKARLGMMLGGLCAVAACLAIRYYWGTSSASAEDADPVPAQVAGPPANASPVAAATQATTTPATSEGSSANIEKKPVPDIVAAVNGRPITREELARECLVHYGKEVLEAMVNKYLILQECRRQGITVTKREVDDEIERMAKRFGIPVDQWLKMLRQERGIKPEQYASDIIWPTLALRKLAGERLMVSQEDLMRAL